jgi:glycerol-3-phosphate acyltransferase PlsY
MDFLPQLGILLLSYLLGAIPFGFLLVKLRTGQDIRTIQSGRTGGTNAMRAAGWAVGLSTGVMDVLKGTFAVMLARWLAPGNEWLAALAPVCAILGHNYSIFLPKRDENGKLKLGGGAGGAAVLGGAMGLWTPALFIILPLGALIYYFIGYASVTTMSAGFLSIIIFGVRAYLGLDPWHYVVYGLLASLLVVWALRPNIRALRAGTERLHGYRARKQKGKSA